VAGTSAGAIVACLLGIATPITASKEKLKHIGPDKLKKMGNVNVRLRSWPGLLSLSKMMLGWPLLNREPLQELLKTLFQGYNTVEALKIPTKILAADIVKGGAHVFCKEAPLVPAILDSCSIPFIFKAWRNMEMSRFVDGGICANLPTEVLADEEEEFGQVVAISFDTEVEPARPKSVIDFTKALVNTTINNSIERAKVQLGRNAVHSIKTDINTFDFLGALQALDTDHYELVKLRCEKWFRSLPSVGEGTNRQQLMIGSPWGGKDPMIRDLMMKVAMLEDAQSKDVTLRVLRSTVIATAYSALDDEAPYSRFPDPVRCEHELDVSLQPLPSFRLALGTDQHPGGPAEWIVKDARGWARKCIVLPMDRKATGLWPSNDDITEFAHANEIALFFTPPLLPGSDGGGPYRVIQQYSVPNAMGSLKENGRDYLWFRNRQRFPVQRVDLVLYVPKSFSQCKPAQYTESKIKLREGQPMSPEELNEYDPPPGFQSVGWSAQDVQPGEAVASWFSVGK
jgi:predicted acylesterase/phospholipase RssA